MSRVDSSDQSSSMLESSTRLPSGDHTGVLEVPVFRYRIISSRAMVCPSAVLKVKSAICGLLSSSL